MYPQSELDNYKLQVELLQEKLKRSEQNRQQLEQQLEKTLQKRSEHDKQVRAKTRQKQQQFLDEQQKRNERNKKMVQMLERIDEQTAAMSARSERLKMMKMQYEMYFAKLVQSQTMRCIQSTTSASIPVLLPTAATMAQAPAATAAAATAEQTPLYAPAANTHYLLNVDAGGCSAPAATAGALTPRGWTLAMATPTPAGMLLTSTPQAAPQDYIVANAYDYLRQPMGYMPRVQQQQLLLQMSGAAAGAPACFNTGVDLLHMSRADSSTDALATLSAFDKINDAVAVATPKTTAAEAPCGNISGELVEADKNLQLNSPAAATTTTNRNDKDNGKQPEPEPTQQQQQQLSTMSTTFSTSAPLTFDKLPKKSYAMTEENIARTEAAAPTATTGATTAAAAAAAVGAIPAAAASFWKPQVDTLRFDNLASGINITASGSDKVALPPSRSEDEAEKSSSYAAEADAVRPRASIDERRGGVGVDVDTDAHKRRQFDEALPQPSAEQVPHSLQAPMEHGLPSERGSNAGVATAENGAAAHHQTTAGGFGELSTANASKPVAAGVALLDATPGNQSSQSQSAAPTPKVSIENIENAIYGELVNPPMQADKTGTHSVGRELHDAFQTQPTATAAVAEPADSFNATQFRADGAPEYPAYATVGGEDTSVSSISYNQGASDSYDPTYATIDGNATAGLYPPQAAGVYTVGANAENYAQYAGADAEPAEQNYTNTDYGNYDGTQYGNVYDPNAYPGYTYDETTGQYTPNSNEQYPTEDPAYGYDASQPDPNYDYSNYAQGMANDQPTFMQSATPEDELSTTPAEPENSMPEEAEPTEPAESALPEIPSVTSALTYADAPPPTDADDDADADSHTAAAKSKPVETPTSILAPSASPNDPQKKKKRVNFLDTDTDGSSSARASSAAAKKTSATGGVAGGEAPSSESDFDFSADAEEDAT